jgi:Holliday junction resolvasome RuvABC endonuclease subunit
MSFVLGVDLSTHHIDAVLLSEDTNAATWSRFDLPGETALDRLLQVPLVLPQSSFYDGVYLAAIEEPWGMRQPGTSAKLNRVYGAIIACLPAELQVWNVQPGAWRNELGLKGNASKEECAEAVWRLQSIENEWTTSTLNIHSDWPQDALDAYAVAYYARETNRRAVEAA